MGATDLLRKRSEKRNLEQQNVRDVNIYSNFRVPILSVRFDYKLSCVCFYVWKSMIFYLGYYFFIGFTVDPINLFNSIS